MNKRKCGTLYEEKAREYLIKKGIEIVCTNFYGNYGEIDIIGFDNKVLVFFEVKYRKNLDFGYPQEAINKNKRKKIYLTAKEFTSKNRLEREEIRFDSVTFIGEEVCWTKNILWGDELGI